MAYHLTFDPLKGDGYDLWLQSDARLFLQIFNTINIDPSVSLL